jgi:VWFA-related protein
MQMSLSVLQKFADYKAGMPGRKLLVWISPGWPFLISGMDQVLESQKQKEQLFNSVVAQSDGLRRARITLYSIDPFGTADAGSLRTTDYKQFLKGVKKVAQADIGNLALQVLASQSGGQVLNSSNDLAGEIATCAADANGYYVLSFEGLLGDGPNEYHALEIKLDKPGLTARTRSGYYAQPERK